MKKLVRTFLTLGKVFSIVFFVGMLLGSLIFFILGIVGLVNPDSLEGVDYEGAMAIGVLFVIDGVLFLFLSCLAIPTFIFTGKLKGRIETAKEPRDFRSAAIGCIVAGALCITFTLVAGILSLVFANKIIETPVVDEQ